MESGQKRLMDQDSPAYRMRPVSEVDETCLNADPLYFRVFRVFRRPPLSRSSVGRISPFPLHDLLLQLGITVCSFVFVGCEA